jgi:hypothetical protein
MQAVFVTRNLAYVVVVVVVVVVEIKLYRNSDFVCEFLCEQCGACYFARRSEKVKP